MFRRGEFGSNSRTTYRIRVARSSAVFTEVGFHNPKIRNVRKFVQSERVPHKWRWLQMLFVIYLPTWLCQTIDQYEPGVPLCYHPAKVLPVNQGNDEASEA